MSNLSHIGSLGLLPSYSVFNDFDSIFESIMGDRKIGSKSLILNPRVNIEETSSGYNIHLAAPGLSRSDFRIHADSGYIKISVDKKEEKDEKKLFVTREYNYNSFSRSWKLPTSVNTDSISARYESGILTVFIPVSSKRDTKLEIKVE